MMTKKRMYNRRMKLVLRKLDFSMKGMKLANEVLNIASGTVLLAGCSFWISPSDSDNELFKQLLVIIDENKIES